MAIVTMNTKIRHENSKTLFQSNDGMVLKGFHGVVVAEASRVRPVRSQHGLHRSASCRKILGKDHFGPIRLHHGPLEAVIAASGEIEATRASGPHFPWRRRKALHFQIGIAARA